MNTLLELKKCTSVLEVRAIVFSQIAPVLRQKLTIKDFQEAERNAAEVHAWEISYQSGNHAVRGYIVEPRNKEGVLPALISNRGGTRDFGAIKPAHLFLNLGRLSLGGYVVFASQYSGGPGSEGVDEWGGGDLEDVLSLYEIISAHPGADQTNIGMFGASRGGMMTYLALTKVSWIKAAVVVAGVTNLKRMETWRPDMWSVYEEIFGETVDAACAQRSILFHAHALSDTVPLLIMHGAEDEKVSPLDSIELASELYTHHKPFRLTVYEGADHFLSEVADDAREQTKDWFERYLERV